MSKKVYNASNIDLIEGLQHVRMRPSMYIGSTGVEGLHHMIKEVVDNSVDEYIAGYCKNILVVIHADDRVSVLDDGRGIPVDKHKSGLSALELVMTKIGAGGKFKRDESGYAYGSGLHGVGVSCVNALSKELEAHIWRDNKHYFQKYINGGSEVTKIKVLKDEKIESETEGTKWLEKYTKIPETGTLISWKPDHSIMTAKTYNYDTVAEMLRQFSFLSPGLSLRIVDERTDQEDTFRNDEGLTAYVKYMNEGRKVIHEIMEFEGKEKQFLLSMALQYSNTYSSNVKSFANNINTKSGGVHVNGSTYALMKVLSEFITKFKMLEGTNLKPLRSDVLEGVSMVISVRVKEPQFVGQTKDSLGNEDLRDPIQLLVEKELRKVFNKDKEQVTVICNKIATAIKARDAASKAKQLIRQSVGKKVGNLPEKLADCSSKDPYETEVFIVEGNSAAGSAKQGRDRRTQAILPLRGKFLNVQKYTLNKALENKEIKSLVSAIGVAPKDTDLSGLRYNRIIIMTDADVDGAHIASLLLTFFVNMMPSLIEKGVIYLAQPPLYRAVWGKVDEWLKTEKDLESFMRKHQNATIKRFKGLGEMNANELYETTMDPEKRSLLKITFENFQKCKEIFELLMGNEVERRREYIIKHALTVDEDLLE